jgi:hypothetical protein
MVHLAYVAITVIVSLALGFAGGRVKNAGKLAAVRAELAKVEASTVAEVKALVAAVKAKL